MTNEALQHAERLLKRVLQASGPLNPADLLKQAGMEEDRAPAEHLRVALWSLLARGEIVRRDDNSLARGEAAA